MILSEEVIISITNRNRNYYKSFGFNANLKSINVPVQFLPKNSAFRIEVKCDICGKKKTISYQKYIKNISIYGYYTCSQLCSKEKVKKTNNEKYGHDYPLQSPKKYDELRQYFINKYGVNNTSKLTDNKIKREKTMFERFGVKTNLILPETHKKAVKSSMSCEAKEKRIITNMEKHGYSYNKSELHKYRLLVLNVTRKHIKKLFENWNGVDFYDNEHIIKNLNLNSNNRLYPSIDHKISIFHGFKNNISPIIIGDISNLCVTKRYINSKKHTNNNINL